MSRFTEQTRSNAKLRAAALVAALAALALCAVWARPALASAPDFSDVADSAWYGGGDGCVAYVAEAGVMTGYAGTDLFGPEDTLTRAQAVTALYRLIEGDVDRLTSDPTAYADIADESGFLDACDKEYYTAALNWAAAEGVAKGHNGYFRPNEPVTREELITLIARSVDFYEPPVDRPASYPPCEDADQVSDWAFDSLVYVLSNWVITGKEYHDPETGTTHYYLRLCDKSTRAEAAAMLMRLDTTILRYVDGPPAGKSSESAIAQLSEKERKP